VLLLLFIGIHTAWDAVTYHVFVSRPGQNLGERADSVIDNPQKRGPPAECNQAQRLGIQVGVGWSDLVTLVALCPHNLVW
jgi:hypothetical protein